jgi:hypothetical protein
VICRFGVGVCFVWALYGVCQDGGFLFGFEQSSEPNREHVRIGTGWVDV